MSKGSEIQDLANMLRGEGFGAEADKLVSKLEKGEKLTRSLEKQLQSIAKKNSADLVKKMKTIRDMEKDLHKLNEKQKTNLKLLKESVKDQEQQNKVLSDYIVKKNAANKAISEFSEMQSSTVKNVRNATESISRHLSVLGLLDAALVGLEAIYEAWFEQQRDWTRGMGEFAMQTGATAAQLRTARTAADAMRNTMVGLGGSLTGIEEAIRFVGDASVAMRMNVGNMSEELQMELLAAERGLGASATEAALMARTLESGLEGGNRSLGDFVVNIREFSESIGANATTIAHDFLDARNTLATFGEDGGDVFRRTATFANTLGFETRRVLDMFRRFDTFSQASDNVNQLNAMFGTTISSFELMAEEDPVRRIQQITDALQSQGYEWANMSRQQRMSIANAMGVSEDEAARLMNGEDMASINAEAEDRARREASMAAREAAAREDILEIIENTSTAFRSISEYIQIIVNRVANHLSPIFNAIRDHSEEIMEAIGGWVDEIGGDAEFQDIIQNIAEWIADLPGNIREFMPTWEEMKETANEMWPTIRSIGEMISSVINFAVENSEAIGVALGALAAGQLLGSLGGVAALLSPGGAILAGVALLGAGILEAANATATMSSRVRELSSVSSGLRTTEENEEMGIRGAAAFESLRTVSGGRSGAFMAVAGAAELMGDVAGFFGATTAENTIEANVAMQTSSYDDIGTNVDTALRAGYSPYEVFGQLLNAAAYSPSNEAGIRRSMGLSEGESLGNGLMRAVEERDRLVHPEMYAEGLTEGAAGSATATAPATDRTTSAPTVASSAGSTTVTATEVTLDGRSVGRALFEVSRT